MKGRPLFSAFLLAGLSALLIYLMATRTASLQVGTKDFVAYWSAFHAFVDHANPYQTSIVFEYQRVLELSNTKVQAFLNPPWTLAIMAPVLAWNFTVATVLWLVLGFGFFAMPLFFLKSPDCTKKQRLAGLLFCVFSFPAYLCLLLGNQSLVLTLFFGLFLTSLQWGRDWLSGILILPLLCKPQLSFLFLLLVGLHLLFSERRNILFYAAFFFCVANGVLLAVNPSIYSQWANPDFSVFQLLTSSWINSLYRALAESGFGIPRFSLFLPALAATAVLAFAYLRERTKANFEKLTVWSLFGACLSSPYIWTYDYAVLSLPFLLSLKQMKGKPVPAITWCKVAGFFLGAQILILTALIFIKDMQNHYAIPFVILAAWLKIHSLLVTNQKSAASVT